jgi:hypothetical protein
MTARRSRALPLLLGAVLSGCFAETDRDRYAAGETGTTSFHNPSPAASLWLDGCSTFGLQRLEDGRWGPAVPAHVCVWAGFAQRVAPGAERAETFVAPEEPGTWRLLYAVGAGCREDRPLAPAHCRQIGEVATDPFEVVGLCEERACGPALGMPNRLCPDGISVEGPTGRCLRDPESGACGWEIASCPAGS